MNPYKPYCRNKMINGEQFSNLFDVDDLKLSHKDKEQLSNIVAKLESTYAIVDQMTVHRGKLHHYLGETMEFKRVQGEVRMKMYGYIKKLVDSLLDDMKGSKNTPAPKYLF